MTHEEVFKRLEESGVDTEEFSIVLAVVEIIPDMLDTLVASIESDFRKAGLYHNNLKHDLSKVSTVTRSYVRKADKTYLKNNSVASDTYGNVSELFTQLLINKYKEFQNGN